MRATVFAFALVCVAGCGSKSTMTDMSMPDMSARVDMAQLSCAGLIQCLSGCTTAACQQKCQGMASTKALTDALALSNCIGMYCLPSSTGMNVDGGPGSCMSLSDTSPACQACTQSVAQGQCSSYFQTCISD